ncbi:succinyl-diaminopimelate desuccinylase [Sphingomicrobium astaxanthinifaciens]|uniref:succinyl-diaminopimelate desuccinylase n=1 Tax=Sphingomicrobium astaxanthinifaciens TaxID=1227949 RepID=UPI001FCA90B9|nr:succinyl-diaminopimelate desuccinylase [Sphingomicrobium astaxanthinifaciens]MCJ7422121.1 succinyl-diaminopimelate desuccinylase [Sphingomicrobium astaxanthinifaciens]
MTDPVDLAAALIGVKSVTPARGEVFDRLEAALAPLGFTCHRFVLGEAPDGPTENMVAIRETGREGPHFAFAGHLDVVPAGEGWAHDPYDPVIEDGILYGRGACDMKSAIAAYVAALHARLPATGTQSLLITGDEEGYATYGTPRIVDWLKERDIRPDMCLIGEPTSVDTLGDTVKIGRRGSLNVWIEVPGHQGHVAYPHLADNPIPRLARIIAALDEWVIDEGNEAFQPSNLEFVALDTPTKASNVIPGSATGQLNIRFTSLHKGGELADALTDRVHALDPTARVRTRVSGESFLTPPGTLYDVVVAAIREETGIETDLSTKGGTSDGRFLIELCPVIDFGLPNATMHKVGEAAAVEDIRALARIYGRVLDKLFG